MQEFLQQFIVRKLEKAKGGRRQASDMTPQPFPEEPLGGWLGRVAGFYRKDIDELATDFGLDLGLGLKCHDWLFLPPQRPTSLIRIGYLTHTAPAALHALEVDECWRTSPGGYWFCRHCLFVNPLDVSSPRWIKEWLNPDNETCPVHGEMEELKARDLSRCRNLNSLLKFLSAETQFWRSRVAKRTRAHAGR